MMQATKSQTHLLLVLTLSLLVGSCAPLLLQSSIVRTKRPATATVVSASNDDSGLDSARAMLFDDQHKSMSRQAELERELLEPNMKEMQGVDKKRRKQIAKKSSGVGFGGSGGTSAVALSEHDQEVEVYAGVLEDDGVVMVPSVLSTESTKSLRECVVAEIEVMRNTIREEPEKSVSLFYVPAEIHFSTPRGYVLLPLRDSESVAKGPEDVGTLVKCTRELLGDDTKLTKLFGRMCDGKDSQLYDFCALRTEPGAARQVIHSDTPYQRIPGLFCAFIALQDVTFEMGGTVFISKTHNTKKSKARKKFDLDGDEKNEMLAKAKPKYALLKAGDAAVFDMRVLHAGLANQLNGGASRYLMAITFHNSKAKESLGHKPNLRPGYTGQFTLGEFQKELMSATPFASVGNGLM